MCGHNHAHGATDAASQRGKLIIVFCITFTVIAAEIIGSVLTGSLALLADAGHMFADSAGLLIALIAASLALKPATLKRTWGYKRAEIVAAAGQAALLLGVGGFVIIEGIRRLFDPPEIGGSTMLWFGIIGLAGNAIGLIVLASGRKNNFNMRAAFLEVLNDALGSVAVILAAVIIAVTGWVQADTVVSLLIGALIIPRPLKLLRETVHVLTEKVIICRVSDADPELLRYFSTLGLIPGTALTLGQPKPFTAGTAFRINNRQDVTLTIQARDALWVIPAVPDAVPALQRDQPEYQA